MKKDIYDEAVEYLSGADYHPSEAWLNPRRTKGGVLFLFCSDSGGAETVKPSGDLCGCLTDVRGGFGPAQTKRITDAIQKDERLPSSSRDITNYDLPVFAEWQRKLDKAFPGRRRSVLKIARESIKATREALKARKRKAAK